MRELIVHDDRELRRLNQAIAAFDGRPGRDRLRMHHLLSALHAARDEIAHRTMPVRARASAAAPEGPSALASHG
jgi:hypothetical protein